MSGVLLSAGVLAVVYALTLASLHPLDLALGFLLGLGLTVLGRRLPDAGGDRRGAPTPLGRLLGSPAFLGALLADVVRGTWDVALRVLHLRGVEHPGIVLVPLGERTPIGVAVSALSTTLSPGSVLVDVDWAHRAMLVHVIDASDPDAIRAQHQRFYERYQRRVFP